MNMRNETIGLVLYGVVTGLVGLLGWELYRARSGRAIDVPPRSAIAPIWKRAVADGVGMRPDEHAWDYGTRQNQWWQKVVQANWTGAEPPKPQPPHVPGSGSSGSRKKQKPLADIISLKLVLAGGDDTRCLVQHEQADVEVPAGMFEDNDAHALPEQQGMAPGTPIIQVMVPGDALWKPYDDIEFERVDATGPYAIFSRTSSEDPNKRIEERLVVDELSMDAESFDDAMTGRPATGRRDRTAASEWRDPGDRTRHIGDAWMVSIEDSERLSQSYEGVLHECGLQDFVAMIPAPGNAGKLQRVRGVSFRRIPQPLARLGIQAGDVLIELNGMPVTSKASAIRVAKGQIRRGVRRFELTFLSKGREVVRVYQAPDR